MTRKEKETIRSVFRGVATALHITADIVSIYNGIHSDTHQQPANDYPVADSISESLIRMVESLES